MIVQTNLRLLSCCWLQTLMHCVDGFDSRPFGYSVKPLTNIKIGFSFFFFISSEKQLLCFSCLILIIVIWISFIFAQIFPNASKRCCGSWCKRMLTRTVHRKQGLFAPSQLIKRSWWQEVRRNTWRKCKHAAESLTKIKEINKFKVIFFILLFLIFKIKTNKFPNLFTKQWVVFINN